MRARRTFTKDFKREAVTSGQVRQLEMPRKYSISPVLISRWKKGYIESKFFENSNPDTTRLEIRLREGACINLNLGHISFENRTTPK